MRGLVVVEHQVDRVSGGADEDYLEDGVVEVLRFVKRPEKVDVAGDVDDEVQELRLEGYAGRALSPKVITLPVLAEAVRRLTLDVFILWSKIKIEMRWDKSPASRKRLAGARRRCGREKAILRSSERRQTGVDDGTRTEEAKDVHLATTSRADG